MIFFPNSPLELRPLLTWCIGILGLMGLVLAVVTFINLESIEQSYVWSGDPLLAQSRMTVVGRLLFPIAWILIILYFAIVRYVMARLQRANELDFKTALSVTIYSAIPLISVGFLFGLYFAIVPYHVNAGWSAFLSLAILGIAYTGEGAICVSGLKRIGGLSQLRGLFTWLSPAIMTFCFCSPFLVLLIAIGGF